MKKNFSVCAIIPAYNEAKRIGAVLSIVETSSHIDTVIVVDDGSTDETAAVAAQFKKVTVVRLPANLGKTGAVMQALSGCKADYIFLFDADLIGLDTQTVDRAIAKMAIGFDLLILNYSQQEFVLHAVIKSFPALSGVRIIARAKLGEVPLHLDDGFALETRINDWALTHDWRMGVLGQNQIRTPHKYEKYPLVIGLFLELQAILSIMLSNGVRGVPQMFRTWQTIAHMQIDS